MSALQELAERTSTAGAHIELRCEKPVLVQSTEVALHVFRIAHEAISNALRHGRASRILIELSEDDENVVLQVTRQRRQRTSR